MMKKMQSKKQIQEILEQIDELFRQEKFKEAYPLCEDLLEYFPNFPISYTTIAIYHSKLGNTNLALDILRRAENLYPHDYDIQLNLGFIEKEAKHYIRAIQYFQKAFALIPENKKYERADCCNDIASCFWILDIREEALKMWRKALGEDPNFELAQNNLNMSTNEYQGAKAPTKIFDDLYHFQKIQTDKYFAKREKKEFSTLEETDRILQLIMKTWNEHIAHLGKKLDGMSAAEKSELFTTIDCDF